MALNVTVKNHAQRQRFADQLERMHQQIDELTKVGPGPRQLPENHAAIIKSARGNARDLAAAIKEWDKANPRKRGRAKRGGG